MRLVLGHSVDDYGAIAQVNMIAWNADQSLHQKLVFRPAIDVVGNRLEKDYDIPAFRFTVVNHRHPLGRRGKRDAIHHQVISHQQRVFHGAGRDDEVLGEKCEDKQTYDQHRADAGSSLKGRFFHFVWNRRVFYVGRRLGW